MATFVRTMVIQRVRNRDDRSQWVDIALTIKETSHTGQGVTFQRNVRTYSSHLLYDQSEQSAPFEVKSKADLDAAIEAFAAAHPD